MNAMKALVIGGSGFIGSHTADELSERGYEVVIYDCVYSPWLRRDQKMIVGDLNNSEQLAEALRDVSIVYHFAGLADIEQSKEKPLETIESNVLGVSIVLDNAVRSGLKRFVYASTMYVYSNQGSFYRASKQAAEIIVEAYAEQFGFEFTFLRYGSLYGPRAQYWNGIRRFAAEILQAKSLSYAGDGSEMREYIHVHDAARLSVDVLNGDFASRAITITGQQLIRVDELFSMLFEISGYEKKVYYQGKESASNHYGHTPYRYSPKSAKKLVPLEFVDLGQGLLDVIEELHHQISLDEN